MNAPVIIAGPTASGKSALALGVAERLNGEIISCDSVQVYRGFDIGAAKPTKSEQVRVPHHLIDCCAADDQYHAARFRDDALRCVAEISARAKLPIIAGGTTLYLSALLSGLSEYPESDPYMREKLQAMAADERYALLQLRNPERAQKLHPNDTLRVVRALELSYQLETPNRVDRANSKTLTAALVVNLCVPNDILRDRIRLRTTQMIEHGLIDEVRRLRASKPRNAPAFSSVGYLEALQFLDQQIDTEELSQKISAATARLAKRQRTFWRNEPGKRGWRVFPGEAMHEGAVLRFNDQVAGTRAKGVQKGFTAFLRGQAQLLDEISDRLARPLTEIEVWHVALREIVGEEARLPD